MAFFLFIISVHAIYKKIILVKNSIREKTCPLTDTSVILFFNFRVLRKAMIICKTNTEFMEETGLIGIFMLKSLLTDIGQTIN